ncbi:MAG: hypothetical protein CVT94_14325 [Bacteroidetes bacterium HGW-Bacteroidetes-11]|jgi:peptidoglycan/xylan/chitin deacetylase (PgdA/CDA1 family)|nr:MAG: hypothetical protein CVT94_14325 [Bacteroidetes bacterium HGW-Bacteroidetes-11]
MNGKQKVIFFRNDDVRDVLDESLINLTELCIKHHVPISHAVEPANLSAEVAEWLIAKKKQHPDIVEIIQHGYNHNCGNPHQKMEFGGNRGFDDQFNDIKKGKEILDSTFGNLWNPVFTFPYGTFNQETLKAVDALDYKIISSKIKFDFKARLKNFSGKLLGKDLILGKKINFHPDFRKGYKFREISVSANLIKKYTGESTADHFSLDEIMEQVTLAAKYTNVIGVLFHHRFHGDHLELTEKLILQLKEKGYRFSTFRDIPC